MTDDPRPGDAERATIDITVDPETMLEIRDELRTKLVHQYHLLLLAARSNRKVGDTPAAQRQEEQAKRTAMMIWCLNNPMPEPPSGGLEQLMLPFDVEED